MKFTYWLLAALQLVHSLACVYINGRRKQDTPPLSKLQQSEGKKRNFWVQFGLSVLPTVITTAFYNALHCNCPLLETSEHVLSDFLLLVPF